MDEGSPTRKRSTLHGKQSPAYGNRPRAASTPKIPKRKLPAPEEDEATKQETKTNRPDKADAIVTEALADRQMLSDSDDEDKKICSQKIQASFVLCCGFLCFGSSMAIIGPTVLELGCLLGMNVGDMSWVFFAQTCSALIGAIFSGIITDRFQVNYNVYLAVVMTIHAVALAALPFMRSLGTLLMMTSFHGLFGGFQDTATNLRMIIMHGQQVPPYLQTLFFFYGVGAFISPIIAGNFLSPDCNHGDVDMSEFAFARRRRHNGIGYGHWIKKHNGHILSGNITKAESPILNAEHTIRISNTRVHFAYFVIAFIHVFVTLGLWYLFAVEEKRRRLILETTSDDIESHHSVSSDSIETRSDRSVIDPSIRTQVLAISFWIAVMVFISDGLQGSFGSYIYTYAVKSNIGISPDDAAYLNSLFWGALALGRLLAIFISMYVSPTIMLLFDICGCLGSVILMFIFRHKILSLWIGTATFGLCLSNIFPTSVSMAESYFRLTGTITCVFVVCSGLGEMAIPLIIGKLFDVVGPVGFLAISCILCFASVGIYTAVIITGRGVTNKMEEYEKLSSENSKNHSPRGANSVPESPSGTLEFFDPDALHSTPTEEHAKASGMRKDNEQTGASLDQKQQAEQDKHDKQDNQKTDGSSQNKNDLNR